MLSTLALLSGVASLTAAETLHSAIVFTRHGDRTAKWFGSTNMTNLGAQQMYTAGDYYRSRYLSTSSDVQIHGISPDRAVFSQLTASAPEEAVLFQTATDFFQGFYPPLNTSSLAQQTLVSGVNVTDPLNGYQFVLINGESTGDPNSVWIQGDNQCPAWTAASGTYKNSSEYQTTSASAKTFYSSLTSLLEPIMGVGNVTYAHAYDVFDLLNVNSVHNASFASQIPTGALDTARYLANNWEYNMVNNASQVNRNIGGKVFAGGILSQMSTIVNASAKTGKFNLMAGSYDTFMSFFGLTNATSANTDFYGLPNYAASMAFELFSTADNATFPTNVNDDLMVRWLFKNGTGADAIAYPLFGQSQENLTYADFTGRLKQFAITSTSQWCSTCGSTASFCVAANQTASAATKSSAAASSSGQKMSNAAAGGIGAAVTLAVVGVLGALAWLLFRKKGRKAPVQQRAMEQKHSGSETDSV